MIVCHHLGNEALRAGDERSLRYLECFLGQMQIQKIAAPCNQGGRLAVLVGGRGGYPLGQIARPKDVHSHR